MTIHITEPAIDNNWQSTEEYILGSEYSKQYEVNISEKDEAYYMEICSNAVIDDNYIPENIPF